MNRLKIVLAAVGFAAVTASPAIAKSNSKFLNDAVQGDTSEATLGRLIRAQGSSSAVRSYGATLTKDHTRAHAEAAALAKKMHVHVKDKMTPEAREERSKLHKLHGSAFDREVRRYMVEDHQKDLAEFREEAKAGDKRTAGLAARTIPVLRKHLALAEALPR